MKQKNPFSEKEKKESQATERPSGFIMLLMIPIFLAVLTFATAITGCISCSIQAMTHRKEMLQAYSLLEDDSSAWRNEVLPGEWRNVYENDYEKVVLKQFDENPKADVILFNIYSDKNTKRFICKKKMKVNHLNCGKFGAVRIAFRRNRIIKRILIFF